MLETLIELDKALFLTLNGWNNAFLDILMPFASGKLSWIPLYAFIIFMLFFRKDWRKAALALVCTCLVFAVCDSVSFAAKNYFERWRPLFDPEIGPMVRVLEGGGDYGFVSGHAANVFGIAMFTSFYVKHRWYSVLMFAWAFLVSYSRIYVGKHFPGDVLVGAIFGILVAAAFCFCYSRFEAFMDKRNHHPKI